MNYWIQMNEITYNHALNACAWTDIFRNRWQATALRFCDGSSLIILNSSKKRRRGFSLSVDYVQVKNSCQLQKTTSNLKKHLHAKNNRVGRERCVPSQAKQQKLDFSSPSPGKIISSPELNKLVAAFIVEEMQPLWSRLHFTISSVNHQISVTGKIMGGRAARSQNLFILFGQCIYGNGERPKENFCRPGICFHHCISMDCSE